jgi:hypothetical protein
MEGASTWVISIDILSTRGRERPAVAATARRHPHGLRCDGASAMLRHLQRGPFKDHRA